MLIARSGWSGPSAFSWIANARLWSGSASRRSNDRIDTVRKTRYQPDTAASRPDLVPQQAKTARPPERLISLISAYASYGHWLEEGGEVGYGATPLPKINGRCTATLELNSLGSTWISAHVHSGSSQKPQQLRFC